MIIDENVIGMEYLNSFRPDNILIEDKMSYREFCDRITTTTFIEKREIINFNSEKLVLFTDEISLVFSDWSDSPVEKKFKASQIPGLPENQFTAGEMFFYIMTTQHELDEHSSYFRKVIFSKYLEENGKRIPQFIVIFE